MKSNWPGQQKPDKSVPSCPTHQYGVPIKDFLFAIVAVILAATPKSAGMKSERMLFFSECDITRRQKVMKLINNSPNFTSPLSVRRIFAPCNKTMKP